jgi:hypothetical protein
VNISDNPFITFITPTYRRPHSLAKCLQSVSSQSAKQHIEHIVLPDHNGLGIAGMYTALRHYADIARGSYVHFLADDDELADYTSVEQLMDARATHATAPPAIIVSALKGGSYWPVPKDGGPPIMGQFDLGCMVVRQDWWSKLVARGAYRPCYEGDYHFAEALWLGCGKDWAYHPFLFMRGRVSHGAAEV